MIPSSRLDCVTHTALMSFLVNTSSHHPVTSTLITTSTGCVSNHTKHADVTWHGLKSRKAHENQMLSSSLGCNGLQPGQHLLKSLSWAATDFQYCNWLRCRGNDFIHSKKWFHFHEAHCARHIPERGTNINLLIHGDIKSLQGRILKMLSFCFKGPNTDLQIWKYGCKMIALPLVEQNKYRDSVQWLCREHSQ